MGLFFSREICKAFNEGKIATSPVEFTYLILAHKRTGSTEPILFYPREIYKAFNEPITKEIREGVNAVYKLLRLCPFFSPFIFSLTYPTSG